MKKEPQILFSLKQFTDAYNRTFLPDLTEVKLPKEQKSKKK